MNFKLISAIITFCIVFTACNTNNEKKETAAVNTESVTQTKPTALTGKWTVNKYVFSEFSAMDEKTAGEWIGKSAHFTNDVVFPFSTITSYKDVFKNDTVCKNFEILKDITEPGKEYLSQLNSGAEKLGHTDEKLRILKTNSPETPFEEIFVENENTIIIRWDGVFFFMNKEK